MMKRYKIDKFEQFHQKIKELEPQGKKIIAYFYGHRDSKGQSWCPDCRQSDPIIKHTLDTVAKDIDGFYIEVDVGERGIWKDKNNPYRTDKRLRINSIPTLLDWNTDKRLDGAQMENIDKIHGLFLK